MHELVFSRGNDRSCWMIVGEAPGEQEAAMGAPFVGKSGQDQESYLSRHGLHSSTAYVTNIMKQYKEGNPDPTVEDIATWTPVMQEEIEHVRPRVILAVGRFAARWFLGDSMAGKSVDMDMIHGIPHRAGAFNSEFRDRGGPNDAVIIPCYHPAFGLHNSDNRGVINWDYEQACRVVNLARAERDLSAYQSPADEYPDAEYEDVTGAQLAQLMEGVDEFGFDTEGSITDAYASELWSLQVSACPGTGYVLRRSAPDFAVGARALQKAIDRGAHAIMHNAFYDIVMARRMGVEFRRGRVWDSMYAAYLTRVEPQGLKPLAYRWVGIRMRDYQDVVGDAGKDKQVEYLHAVDGFDWGKPEPRVKMLNDGTAKLYKPQGLNRRIAAILSDVYGEKQSDPYERWKQVDDELRMQAEAEFGKMPVGTLNDVPLQEAVNYAARDADATLRTFYEMTPYLQRHGFDKLMADGMELLPVFEEMQSEGMPASRKAFAQLDADMGAAMQEIQSKISYYHFNKQPFNPGSPKDVAQLMEEQGLRGAKRSKKTGKISTGKKSIEHFRKKNEAIGLVIDWREHAKIRDSFCAPVLERLPESQDRGVIRCQIKTTRVHTRRLAASDPNLLAMPVRNELGRRVRAGYECEGNEVFGAWDLSQVEMRVMAGLSKDPLLLRLFTEIDPTTGKLRDPHSETAARMFGIPVAEVDEIKHRYPAKRVAFGVITSIAGAGLYDQLRMAGAGDGWDEESCEELIKDYFKVYPGVRKYMDDCIREIRRNGYIKDKWGMVRMLPGVWSNDFRAKAEAERTASSHVIQGTAQGMIQNSMRWLKTHIVAMQEAGLNVKWQLQIHDELIFRFDEDLWDTMDALVMEALTEHHELKGLGVPITAKGHMAKNWAGLK